MSRIADAVNLLRVRYSQVFKFFFAGLVASFAVGLELKDLIMTTQRKENNLVYERQVERLDQVQESLANLAEFVTQQQDQLKNSRATLQRLEDEKEKLAPVVEADREVVEAILRAQAERNQASVWTDRGVGFLSGIVGSLLASAIFGTFRRRAA